MELVTSGLILIVLIFLGSALIFSFMDKETSSSEKKSQHFRGHKKILTQDGMVAKKSPRSEPLWLLGDSKTR